VLIDKIKKVPNMYHANHQIF